MLKILNIDPDNYSEKSRTILQGIGKLDEKNVSRNKLISIIKDYDVLILRLSHSIDKEILSKAKNLKVIATNTTGLDHIDLQIAEKRKIKIISLKGEYDFLKTINATAELTWGLLLSLIRYIPSAINSTIRGEWNRYKFIGHELSGKRLGILGLGRIGEKIACYGHAFNMKVAAYDSDPLKTQKGVNLYKTMAQLIKNSDVLTIHVPLNDDTTNLITDKELLSLPTGAFLINTSRGAIIDNASLIKALNSKHIAGAAIDVLTEERKDMDNHPLIKYARSNSNLLITPHIGGAAYEAMNKTEEFIAEKVSSYLNN